MSIVTTDKYSPNEPGVVFKFPYHKSREFYAVGPMRGGVKLTSTNYIMPTATYLDPNSCMNGQYYHNNDVNSTSSRMISVCQSGKDRARF